ncbi:hypothetical protein FACS1894152_6160 [Bacilli bacterium]|nr:hypothetical protein FACS1894152_6160 [Bacilli bacterium]
MSLDTRFKYGARKMDLLYIQRWKIECFHYVLKSGCNIEKIQQRSVARIETLLLMYSIIAVFIRLDSENRSCKEVLGDLEVSTESVHLGTCGAEQQIDEEIRSRR